MIAGTPSLEQLRLDLKVLINRHRRTRRWFWRTGSASLAGAGLWIVMYMVTSEDAGVKEKLATLVGAILMWILFLWAFLLFRKLNRLTHEVRQIEKQLMAVMVSKEVGLDN